MVIWDLKNIRTVVKEEIDKRAEETELKIELRFNVMEKQMEQDRQHWSNFFNQAGYSLMK